MNHELDESIVDSILTHLIFQTDTLWFFNDQLCRAMPLVFEKQIEQVIIKMIMMMMLIMMIVQEGLPGLRFVPSEEVFMSAEKYPQ